MTQTFCFDSMNETDVREMIVRPFLEQLGYRHGTDANIVTEKKLSYPNTFLGCKNPTKDPPLIGRADYICDVISFGRWVVEVKSPLKVISQDTVEQAHTYASHPNVAASFFLITNGRTFQLYETSKLENPALSWSFEDTEEIFLRVYNVLSPIAFRQRARLMLIDPGMPLGTGLGSRLRIIGGTITYEKCTGNHPFLRADSLNGMILPILGGYVVREDDNRISTHLKMAKGTGYLDFNNGFAISDEYDFYTAAKFISTDPAHPSIFQNRYDHSVALGTPVNLPGFTNLVLPMEISTNAYTEAVGYVNDNKFVGTMQLDLNFTFSNITSQVRMALVGHLGNIPETAKITGLGRFEIEVQSDL